MNPQEHSQYPELSTSTQALQIVRELKRYVQWQKEQGWRGAPLAPEHTSWTPTALASLLQSYSQKKQPEQRRVGVHKPTAPQEHLDMIRTITGSVSEPSPVHPVPVHPKKPEEAVVRRTPPPPVQAYTPPQANPIETTGPLQVGALRTLQPIEVRPSIAVDEQEQLGQRLIYARETLGECVRCPLAEHRKHLTYGRGPVRTRLMVVYPQPTLQDDQEGQILQGTEGQLVRNMLAAIGVQVEDTYVAYHTKCRPPQDRHPFVAEVNTCLPFVVEQIRTLQPEVVLVMGAIAAQSLLQTNQRLESLRGKWFALHEGDLLPQAKRSCHMLATYHPMYLLNRPHRKRDAWRDLQLVRQKLVSLL